MKKLGRILTVYFKASEQVIKDIGEDYQYNFEIEFSCIKIESVSFTEQISHILSSPLFISILLIPIRSITLLLLSLFTMDFIGKFNKVSGVFFKLSFKIFLKSSKDANTSPTVMGENSSIVFFLFFLSIIGLISKNTNKQLNGDFH